MIIIIPVISIHLFIINVLAQRTTAITPITQTSQQ